MIAILSRWMDKISGIQRYIDRPWYPYLVALLVFLDMFLLVIPSDGLLVSAVLLRPRRWVRTFVIVSTGSALGALFLAYLLQWNPEYIMNELFPYLFQNEGWKGMDQFVDDYGAWALGVVALSPFPQIPAVVVAALAGMPLLSIFLACWLGRMAKYALFAWLASHAPRYLMRFKGVRKEIEELNPPPPGPGPKSEPTAP